MLIRIVRFITVILLITLGFSEGIVGEYRLTGLNIVDYDFCRQNTDIVVTEKSGFDSTPLAVYTIQQGENIDYDPRIPYPLYALTATEVQIGVYFASDGTATIMEGSMYPTEQSSEGCFTEEVTLPIQEDFSYSANLNSNEYIPVIDILGFESLSPYSGFPTGSISITGSSVFDVVPITPTELSIPFPIDTSSVFNNNNGAIPADTILPGMTAGYAIKSTEMYTFIPDAYDCNNPSYGCPPRPSLYLEWHSIDGTINESGLGDLIGEDEDGDGTDFDSIYGLDKIKITKVYSTNECGINSYDIAGNHIEDLQTVKYNQCLNEGGIDSECNQTADNWINNCINFNDIEDEGNNLYVIDLEQDPNFNWGGYITWNSILYNSTQNQDYLIDDSNENFNSACMSDNDYSDCSGRILFEYTPQCIPSFNTRYFMAELQEQCQEVDKDECGVCFGNGIPEGYCDCYFGYKDCNGNCDEDPLNDDLSCFGCDGTANSGLEIDECGLCGGSGKSTYCLDIDGDGIGNQNLSMEYCPYEVLNSLWVLDCSSLDNTLDDVKINQFGITKTYPNPFNPILNIEFSIANFSAIDMKIYDLNGNLILDLLKANYNAGIHTITWDATSFASGVYFIELKTNEYVNTRIVELIK